MCIYVGLKAWIRTIHGLRCSKHAETEGLRAWIWAIHGLTWTKHGFTIAKATRVESTEYKVMAFTKSTAVLISY